MKLSASKFLAAVTLLVALSIPASAQDLASQIVGVWKVVSNTNKEVATGKVFRAFGENPIGYSVFTKGGRTFFTQMAADRAKPTGATATDAERLKLFATLAAGSGTYKIEGNVYTVTYDSSWNQFWTGTTQKRKIAISGNKLTITSDPTKNLEGQEVVFEVVFERIE
jgi:hypothetical protein